MPFQVKPQQEFLVRPALPDSLTRLNEIAYNLIWAWDHNVRAVFRRLDPTLWRASGHNPVLMLSQLPPATLEKTAADPRYMALFRRACERFDAYVNRTPPAGHSDRLVAYFCMEFGLVDCMPTYSGGLGILAGDHMKAASDADLPLVGVGLLYQKGYLRQVLNPDGWQQERYPVNDFYLLPLLPVHDAEGRDLTVSVEIPNGPLHAKVWQMNVGRVRLYLLDTNIDINPPQYRDITDQLYGGDNHARIRQELVLGIGGLRALKALGLAPTVFHMNEGHSAFLAIERIRLLMAEQRLSFEEALEASRQNNVFTTHTSVPAGFDLFEPSLVHEYFRDYCDQSGISFGAMLALGRGNPNDTGEPFSMAISAIKTSSWRNAVSHLHQKVSQEMFQYLWPGLPTSEVPIAPITNGVHLPTWLSGDLAAVYDQYLQPDWIERYKEVRTWESIADIPDAELWEAHRRRKRRLIQFVRTRTQAAAMKRKASTAELRRLSEVLEPDVLTIGFARRFATYKRATLLFKDIERLKRILNHPDMPVQIVIAGKAHPKDVPGKAFIREIWQLSRDPDVSRRIVFVEDYSIQVGRELVQGVDLWLNNPRRGEEACGTSGMKAALNGVLNLSVLDGWYDEAYEISGGWAIGDRVPYSEDQDDIHASALYSLLENEIAPMFYRDRDRGGVPEEWMRRVKQCIGNLSPRYNFQRMLGEYDGTLYAPAHRAFAGASASNFDPARRTVAWMAGVRRAWEQVRILETGPRLDNPAISGKALKLHAVVELAGLSPDDVKVEALLGRIGVEGYLENPIVVLLAANGQDDTRFTFSSEHQPTETGRLGLAVRVSPNHGQDPLNRPCDLLIRWA